MKIKIRNFKSYLKFKHNTKYVHNVIYNFFFKKREKSKK